jgi:hypothetical protein
MVSSVVREPRAIPGCDDISTFWFTRKAFSRVYATWDTSAPVLEL